MGFAMNTGQGASLESFVTHMSASGPLPAVHGSIFVDATAGDVVVTLPLASEGAVGVTIQQVDNSENTVTVQCSGSDTFSIIAESSLELKAPNTCITIVADSADNAWLVVSALSQISLVQTLTPATPYINACMVYNSQSQAVNAATGIQSAYDTVIDQNVSAPDDGTPFWNPATPTYLTIPALGYFLVNAGYSINPSAGPGQTYIQIFKKGYPGGDETCFAQQSQEQNQATDNQSLNVTAVIACVPGDQIYVMIGNSGPDNLSVFGGISTCYLSVAQLS
jgi:hypothetical protein